MTSSVSRAFVALALPVLLSGCATYELTKQPPAASQPISITFSNEGPSGWSDLPIGAYRVPNSTVIVSGQQRGGVGAAFGLLGVMVQDSIQTKQEKDRVGDADAALHVDLTPQAQAITQSVLASGRFGTTFSSTPAASGPSLTVSPFTVITFTDDANAVPYVFLKATLKSGSASWTTRYIATTGKPMPLAGDGSLTADGGKVLNDLLKVNLDRAVNVMLDDVANRHPRDENNLIYVESGVPYVRLRFGLIGYKLSDDGTTFVYVPKAADANVFAGVYILDKSVVNYRPATPNDKIRLLEDGK